MNEECVIDKISAGSCTETVYQSTNKTDHTQVTKMKTLTSSSFCDLALGLINIEYDFFLFIYIKAHK